MSSKTYFQYQGNLSSQDLSEACGLPSGMGPFMGFSQVVDMNGASPRVKASLGDETLSRSLYFRDAFDHRSILHKVGSVNPKFGLVTKDGHIYVTDLEELPITMMNTSSGRSELTLWALYQNIQQPINNSPTIVGYWNTSAYSLYDEFYAPLLKYSGTDNTDLIGKVNFTNLHDRVKNLVPSATLDKLTFIGVYGQGSNPLTGNVEEFSLVPYEYKWPYNIPFTPSTYNEIKGAIKTINTFLEGTGYNSLKDALNSITQGEEEVQLPPSLPIGSIILWSNYGNTSIPDGWEVCDGTNGKPNLMGRFALGQSGDYAVGDTGGNDSIQLSGENLPAHTHIIDPSETTSSTHSGSGSSSGMRWVDKLITKDPIYKGSGSSVYAMPPYCVVIYIIKIR